MAHQIIITERQLNLIGKNVNNSKNMIQESEWYNMVGDVLGIVDPTGIVDVVNGISYFSQGDHLFGLLSLISAVPYAGDVVAKPVMGALKIGSSATKELKVAMDLAKVGKTVEASASLAKLAKEPGVVGKFLRGAESWAPKIAEKVERLPGGIFKGFKDTILGYLKLLETAGAKSAKFGREAGNMAKYLGNAAKPVENIKALQTILKGEKIAASLPKTGKLANIFIGGAPRLLGNRSLRILMRRTKFWLGFLDYIGIANFVGPDELINKMGQSDVQNKLDEYSKTTQAKEYAKQDFGDQTIEGINQPNSSTSSNTSSSTTSDSNQDPMQKLFHNLFTGNAKELAFLL